MESLDLNRKINVIIEKLGFTSSKFADYIEVSRPIISHIIAGRNKPSLEIIQKILKKFPELGMDWTFDGNNIDENLLIRIANDINNSRKEEELGRLRESISDSSPIDQMDIFDSKQSSSGSNRGISKIVVFYDDNSFTEFNPSK